MAWIVIIALALLTSLSYRGWRYRAIRRRGHEVQWRIPIVEWIRRRRPNG